MAVGMATVFAFLGLLVVAIGVTGRIIAPIEARRALADAAPATPVAGRSGAVGTADAARDEELAVAIATATAWVRSGRGAG